MGLASVSYLRVLVFHVQPGYLAFAFPVGTQRIVTWQTLGLSVGAGMLAAFVGVMVPMRTTVTQAIRTSAISGLDRRGSRRIRATVGVLLLAVTTLILVLRPQAAVPGSLALLAALLCLLPLLFEAIIASLAAITRSLATPATKLALIELEDPGVRVRLLAVAATGAVAVFGSVAIQGAQHNLQTGLDRTSRESGQDHTALGVGLRRQ